MNPSIRAKRGAELGQGVARMVGGPGGVRAFGGGLCKGRRDGFTNGITSAQGDL